jgi:hypothetical protein
VISSKRRSGVASARKRVQLWHPFVTQRHFAGMVALRPRPCIRSLRQRLVGVLGLVPRRKRGDRVTTTVVAGGAISRYRWFVKLLSAGVHPET